MFDEKGTKTVPGPGAYSESPQKVFPQYSMGARIKDLEDKTKTPGAGTYNSSKDAVMKQAPQYGMGIKLKSDLVGNSKAPGPGTYVNNGEKMKHSSPSYGFGTMKRPDIGGTSRDNSPGPGTYAIKSKIG